MDWIGDALSALVPSVGVGLIFWFVMRAVIHADRRERAAIAQLEAEEQAAAQSEQNAPQVVDHKQ
ncbi:hypothetical protein [Cellulomonas bogoriensis]|uniref:Lysyl-tRNA synthetase n=1 Tax=Cellulomonas bogoriensis 69B4 = DSM 16987 TaxID=1386082 RepID=A0A0A0BSY3_9CELL|nr:hypothetical protein [Cellulomonas bogoriensis]KGM10767.1 lysyl-tRNA synthetase [Cellulomonas bogoriensis 69B4 = DSM 16987]